MKEGDIVQIVRPDSHDLVAKILEFDGGNQDAYEDGWFVELIGGDEHFAVGELHRYPISMLELWIEQEQEKLV